jgi:outer membrane protein
MEHEVMKFGKCKSLLLLVVACATLGSTAMAKEQGDWIWRVGIGSVDPKSSNGNVASVDSGTTLVFNGTYMFTPTLGLEVLASLPFSHDVNLVSDGSKVGETKHLPPTFSLQYHFPTDGPFDPYAGLGVNYTIFFDQETTGALAGLDLDLDNSFGLAAQLGFDYQLSDSMFLNIDARWIDIETDADLNGVPLETVDIDPLVYSISVGWVF